MSLASNIDLIDEIGEYLGFDMWNKRDKTKEYCFAGYRDGTDHGDDYVEGNVIEYMNTKLLVFQYKQLFHQRALYTLNLKTKKPTKTSPQQKQLTPALIEKLSECREEYFNI